MKESNFHVNAGQANQTIQTKENTMNAMSAVNELSNLNNNRTMSSREIAALTGKLHAHIMRDIRGLVEQGAIDRSKLGSISFQDSYGREQTAYKLDFDATMTLVTGYNAVLRAKVIKRWRELEEGVYNAQKVSSEPVQFLPSEIMARDFDAYHHLARAFGLEGNQALLKADKAVKKLHNISPMALLEIELKSPDNEALLIVTEVGKKLDPPVSAKNVNLHLAAMGFQERVEYRTGKFEWRLTEKGKAYGSYLDTGKVHSNGTPIQQIKWKESIIPLMQKYLISLAC